jgi:hypothetical protein
MDSRDKGGQGGVDLIELTRVPDNDGSAPAPKLNDTVIAQLAVGPKYGVHIQVERVSKVTGGRKPLPRGQLTASKCSEHLSDQLGVQRLVTCWVNTPDHEISIYVLWQIEQVGSRGLEETCVRVLVLR